MAELEGLGYLRENIIKNRTCDQNRPFVFISYAHDREDAQVVRNVFCGLADRGYNLWIDTANIPKNENSWSDAAQDAIISANCRLAFFFRSEESVIREPVYEELYTLKNKDTVEAIVTIDIWHQESMTAEKYKNLLLNAASADEEGKRKYKICNNISKVVDINNSAYRIQDVDGKLDVLLDELETELKEHNILSLYGDKPQERNCEEESPQADKTEPNEERKEGAAAEMLPKEQSPNPVAEFWKGFQEYCQNRDCKDDLWKEKLSKGRITENKYYNVSVGGSGLHIELWIKGRTDKTLDLILYVKDPNKLQALMDKKEALERAFGGAFDWSACQKQDQKAWGIVYKKECDALNPDLRKEHYAWLAEHFDKLCNSLEGIGELNSRKNIIKTNCEGRLIVLKEKEKYGKVETGEKDYGVLTVYFNQVTEEIKKDCMIKFDIVISEKTGIPYARFLGVKE